jgi:hypothetical protein
MHQPGSPLTSGRTVLWRTFPILLISPVLSSLVNNHDLKIYLPVMYGFLIAILIQYRKLCHEWSSWLTRVPTLRPPEIEKWYTTELEKHASSGSSTSAEGAVEAEPQSVLAVRAFRKSVEGCSRQIGRREASDSLVVKTSHGMPYAQWLLQKEHQHDGGIPEAFSSGWFAELQNALKSQQQLSRGLKEHSPFMLFRFARFDVSLWRGIRTRCSQLTT